MTTSERPDTATTPPLHTESGVAHHFTVDVEEYFQVSAFESAIPRAMWHSLESRVSKSVHELLELMDDTGAVGTFFILGWVAEHHPQLVKDIAAAGHEIASHGWVHRRVTDETHDEFRRSVRHTKELLEELTSSTVFGFRAPSFSIKPGYEWALDVLLEEGYRYDSSLFPIRRPGYGYPAGERDPYTISRPSGDILEIPPATIRRLGVTLPAAGGAYLRHLPLGVIRSALTEAQERGVPATLYIHPWEIDPDQPRMPVGITTTMRHYGGLRRTFKRLRTLLSEFTFDTIARTQNLQ